MENLPISKDVKKKQFLVIRKGLAYLTIKTDDICYIYTGKDVVYIVNNEGRKFSSSQNLNALERELDNRFFRASRQCIVNIHFIRSFKPMENNKLVVELNVNNTNVLINVSQVTAPRFKEWILNF